ncbi:hypothetical protein Syun_006823 [Stephania yunnanensis]|uniref:Uncharacterized protein n=1 Tax=Stephania yunnanensis TaxID=152371 RepID=A0AAP0KX91_9MAGN
MEAFPFDTAPTSSRHFHASPIMMNLSGSTSTQDGGMRDNDNIQPEDAQNSVDVGHTDIPLALNRNVRDVKRTRCGTGSHYLGIPPPPPPTKIPKSHKFVVSSRLGLCSPLETRGVRHAWLGDSGYVAFTTFPASQSSWDAFMGTDDSKSRARFAPA